MMILTQMLLAAAALAQPGCPIERSVYRLDGAPEFTAGFARQDRRSATASNLAFWLKTPQRTYWFSFSSPNGYGGAYITPDLDPAAAARMDDDAEAEARQWTPAEGEEPIFIEFDAFAADLAALQSPPATTDPAPALLFARGLGPALSYNAVGLARGDQSATMESMPIGLFEYAECAQP